MFFKKLPKKYQKYIVFRQNAHKKTEHRDNFLFTVLRSFMFNLSHLL